MVDVYRLVVILLIHGFIKKNTTNTCLVLMETLSPLVRHLYGQVVVDARSKASKVQGVRWRETNGRGGTLSYDIVHVLSVLLSLCDCEVQ